MCFLVQFDLLFAFGVLSCRILDTASLFILYVHDHNRLGFGMLTLETAVFDCICWFSSSRDRKGQSYPVEYCLESVEEYSEGRVHKSEPEPRNGNVNAVYIRPGEILELVAPSLFTMNANTRSQIFTYIWTSCSEYVRKNILLQISFYA